MLPFSFKWTQKDVNKILEKLFVCTLVLEHLNISIISFLANMIRAYYVYNSATTQLFFAILARTKKRPKGQILLFAPWEQRNTIPLKKIVNKDSNV